MSVNIAIKDFPILKVNGEITTEKLDQLAVEEPLEISISVAGSAPQKASITMRTPGNDKELSCGFLFTEGIIKSAQEILKVTHTQTLPGVESNTILVTLHQNTSFNPGALNRNFYTTSSCGVCGKASIDAIETISAFKNDNHAISVPSSLLPTLPEKLRLVQETFDKTGGLHAAALFDLSGNLVVFKEDVGRHNALDKLIGHCLFHHELPIENHILLLSGRASFELIQKASMAGIKVVCAVGAPSSLAVETALQLNIALIGFLNATRYNIYSRPNSVEFK